MRSSRRQEMRATCARQTPVTPGDQEVNDSARWLKAQLSFEMPEHELLSTDPWQPPLSRWIAQMDSRPSEWSRAKLRIRFAPES